jgi:hypothetical protein
MTGKRSGGGLATGEAAAAAVGIEVWLTVAAGLQGISLAT